MVRMSPLISILSKVMYCLQPSPADRQLKSSNLANGLEVSFIVCTQIFTEPVPWQLPERHSADREDGHSVSTTRLQA